MITTLQAPSPCRARIVAASANRVDRPVPWRAAALIQARLRAERMRQRAALAVAVCDGPDAATTACLDGHVRAFATAVRLIYAALGRGRRRLFGPRPAFFWPPKLPVGGGGSIPPPSAALRGLAPFADCCSPLQLHKHSSARRRSLAGHAFRRRTNKSLVWPRERCLTATGADGACGYLPPGRRQQARLVPSLGGMRHEALGSCRLIASRSTCI